MSFSQMLERHIILTSAEPTALNGWDQSKLCALLEREGISETQYRDELTKLRARLDSACPITGDEGVTEGPVRFK